MSHQSDQGEGDEGHVFSVQGVWIVPPLWVTQDVAWPCIIRPNRTQGEVKQTRKNTQC